MRYKTNIYKCSHPAITTLSLRPPPGETLKSTHDMHSRYPLQRFYVVYIVICIIIIYPWNIIIIIIIIIINFAYRNKICISIICLFDIILNASYIRKQCKMIIIGIVNLDHIRITLCSTIRSGIIIVVVTTRTVCQACSIEKRRANYKLPKQPP
jgi:hypothetical protein